MNTKQETPQRPDFPENCDLNRLNNELNKDRALKKYLDKKDYRAATTFLINEPGFYASKSEKQWQKIFTDFLDTNEQQQLKTALKETHLWERAKILTRFGLFQDVNTTIMLIMKDLYDQKTFKKETPERELPARRAV